QISVKHAGPIGLGLHAGPWIDARIVHQRLGDPIDVAAIDADVPEELVRHVAQHATLLADEHLPAQAPTRSSHPSNAPLRQQPRPGPPSPVRWSLRRSQIDDDRAHSFSPWFLV